MKKTIRIFSLALTLSLSLAGFALADVSNGDFEAGSTDWNLVAPPRWTIDVRPGGNPGEHGYIMSPFGDSAGIACFEQEFDCGVEDPDNPSDCLITLDYYLHIIDASPGTGRVVIGIDGITVFVSPPGVDWIDWTTLTFVVPCGRHTLSLCLEVDPINNGWEAGFDNVIAECDDSTPTDGSDWSTIKSLY